MDKLKETQCLRGFQRFRKIKFLSKNRKQF